MEFLGVGEGGEGRTKTSNTGAGREWEEGQRLPWQTNI